MTALLHCICEGIERDRVSIKINNWRHNQLNAKLAVIEAMELHFTTSLITYDEEGDIDLWEELRDFNFNPVMCAEYPKCKTGIYWKYKYILEWSEGAPEWQIYEEDPNDYLYYCWGCYKQKKVLKLS